MLMACCCKVRYDRMKDLPSDVSDFVKDRGIKLSFACLAAGSRR